MLQALFTRHLAFLLSFIIAAVSAALAYYHHPQWLWALAAGLVLCLVGLIDLLQHRRTVSRNYPILAHFRYFLESIGPEIRQYFIERDTEAVPFSRQQRSLVYQRAKNVIDKRPFGTLIDVYREGYEWINHSITPAPVDSHNFRISIGTGQRAYSASVFNISAMSFGALSPAAIRALNEGAKRGQFYHDTGEGSISSYHRENGGDLVWEIGSGYFGCRDKDGRFDSSKFADNAIDPQVKMIELKLSQGAKPGQGGILPGAKVTKEIAQARGVEIGQDCVSPASHSAFSTPIDLLLFIAKLRELSGGKPTGFKLAIGHPWEWFAIAKAMQKTGITPDFIVVDGGEGGTGAAPVEFTDHVGLPMREGLLLVHNTLVGLNLRDRVRIGAAGKLVSGFDLARTIALGADWCNAARGFMFALGCIQAQSCHTGKCPSGVATQDASRWRSLDVPDKATRVYQFHKNTLKALKDIVAAAGLQHPSQLGPEHVLRRVSATQVRSLAALYRFIAPGELLAGNSDHAVFSQYWAQAQAENFAAPASMMALRGSKLL